MRIKLMEPGSQDYDAVESCRRFEREIGERFRVSPVDARRSYEELEDGIRVSICTFGYTARGELRDAALVDRLWAAVLRDVCALVPPGSEVIWRRRPEAVQEENADRGRRKECWVTVSIRLGANALRDHRQPMLIPELGGVEEV